MLSYTGRRNLAGTLANNTTSATLTVFDTLKQRFIGNPVEIVVYRQGRGGRVNDRTISPETVSRTYSFRGVEFEGWCMQVNLI